MLSLGDTVIVCAAAGATPAQKKHQDKQVLVHRRTPVSKKSYVQSRIKDLDARQIRRLENQVMRTRIPIRVAYEHLGLHFPETAMFPRHVISELGVKLRVAAAVGLGAVARNCI